MFVCCVCGVCLWVMLCCGVCVCVSLCLSVCLSVCVCRTCVYCVYASVCLPVCVSACLSTLSVCLHVCLPVVSVYLSVCLALYCLVQQALTYPRSPRPHLLVQETATEDRESGATWMMGDMPSRTQLAFQKASLPVLKRERSSKTA